MERLANRAAQALAVSLVVASGAPLGACAASPCEAHAKPPRSHLLIRDAVSKMESLESYLKAAPAA